MPMLKSSRARALLLGLSLVLIVEAALRLTVPEERLLFAWEHPDGMVQLMGNSVWVRESSNQHGTDGPYPYEIQTNALGMRDAQEHELDLPAGTDRYLALGDSWIFGTSVTQSSTIGERLEVELTAATGRPTVVMNGGIPGGSAFEMLARWTELKDKFELTGVVLGIPHNAGRQRELAGIRGQLFHPTAGAPYVNNRIYLALRRIIAPYTRPKYAEGGAAQANDDEGMLNDVEALVVDARSRGLTVTVIEDPGHMNEALGTPRRLNRRWRDALEPHGAVVAGHALNTRDCWGFEDLGHPGESGTAVMATVVARAMTAGASVEGLQQQPRCADVAGAGPGKPGWPVDE